MKGDPKVIAALQEAITLELAQALQYKLDYLDSGRLGLDIADALKTRHEQCEEWADSIAGRLLFLEGAPIYSAQPVKTHDSVPDIISGHIAAETAIVERYAALTVVCWEAGDMDNFHYFQHLSKWHRQGGNDFHGHLSWLQKQQWQLNTLGTNNYIAEKI